MQQQDLIRPHGGYKNLKSYQMATIIQDFTVEFCKRYIDKYSRTNDQMVQAARSGKQNIAEGSQASGTSQKTEIKLINVARASLEELKADYEDFIRQQKLAQWNKAQSKAQEVRKLAYKPDKSYQTYSSYMANPETAANCAITIISQANYLLDKQLNSLESSFLEKGGFTERMHTQRKARRKRQADRWGMHEEQLSPEEFRKRLEEDYKNFEENKE